MSKSLPDNVFRGNVGAVIINDKGKVLSLERIDIRGAWQLPQGGLGEGEEAIEAAFREIQEETSIDKEKLKLLAEYPDWLAYELSKDQRTGKHGRGQVQKWFLFRFTGRDEDIDIKNVDEQEFCTWQWTTLEELTKLVPSFRKPIYEKLKNGFSQYLKK